ncbi:MAG: type I restriction enzyme HsdR N-terminal domain-containing protein [Chitinophagaceae bacterium]|nr:type I restriction enzyme HsdR N-terminal domain-containing protein [Chitinophagaceae bacterium]
MLTVQYPEPEFRIRKEEGREQVFDRFRKKWVTLTPEEWVRQNFVAYLAQVLKYPESLLAIEKEIKLGELSKRFDILIYNREHQPWLMVECKAPEVNLSEDVLQQVLRYSITLPVTYLLITNGSYTMGWKRENGQLQPLSAMPVF